MVDEHVKDIIPAYALGSLENKGVEVVKKHLQTCKLCRAESQVYQEVVGQMAFTLSQCDPPVDLKSGLMDRVQAASGHKMELEPAISWRQRILNAMSDLSPAWGLASLVVILVLAVSNVLLWQRVSDLRTSLPLPLHVVALSGAGAAPDASGVIIISRDGWYGTLVVDELPDLGKEQQYQLWLIQDGHRASGAVFSVSSEGYGSVWISSPERLDDYSAFGITIEPTGGSPGPTGEKVLGGEF